MNRCVCGREEFYGYGIVESAGRNDWLHSVDGCAPLPDADELSS